jgi:hypothetical protein
VVDGRDIGTVIFPDADAKIFVTATPEVRAHRRTLEFRAAGAPAAEADILADILRRDERDTQRTVAPLKPAPAFTSRRSSRRPHSGYSRRSSEELYSSNNAARPSPRRSACRSSTASHTSYAHRSRTSC